MAPDTTEKGQSLRFIRRAFFLAALAAFILLPAVAEAGSRFRQATESASQVKKFWSPERMAKARDLGSIHSPFRAGAAASLQMGGRGGAGLTGGATVSHQPDFDAPTAIGRIFFRWLGMKSSCSGAAIDTPSQRLVLTAAHCLQLLGIWGDHFYFVPDYFYGDRPYGSWSWSAVAVTKPWARHPFGEMFNFDIGVIATRRTVMGKRLGNVVGSLPYRTFPRRWGRSRIYGYPAGANRGREVRVCGNRSTWAGPWWSRRMPGPVGIGAWCNMAGGSSGGPWLTAYQRQGKTKWLVDGLVSTGYKGRLASPYFGVHLRRLINQVERRTR